MTVQVKKEMQFWEILENAWSGAILTLKTIEEHDKEEEFMYLIDEMYPDGVDETELNDLLWFDDEFVLETLGIDNEEDEEEEEEE